MEVPHRTFVADNEQFLTQAIEPNGVFTLKSEDSERIEEVLVFYFETVYFGDFEEFQLVFFTQEETARKTLEVNVDQETQLLSFKFLLLELFNGFLVVRHDDLVQLE